MLVSGDTEGSTAPQGVYEDAELYCGAFDFSVEDQVDWVLGVVPGVRRVLEPMCGNARYGRVFAARGIDYVGFDRCRSMLRLAREEQGMTLIEADARDFEIGGQPFDLAWCPIDSIRHFAKRDDVTDHLRCVHRHLAASGKYVVEIDLMRRDVTQPLPPDGKSQWSIEQPDGSRIEACVYAERCDLASRREWERSIYRRKRDGRVVKEVSQLHEMRMITWADWSEMVAEAGFTITNIFRHDREGRPRARGGDHLENGGVNHYFVLQK